MDVYKNIKMDHKYKQLLQQNQKDIVKDLDVTYIIDELFTKQAISNEDFDHIFVLTNRVDQTRYLIDNLIQHGTNHCYEAFVDSLSKDYKWLWEKFQMVNAPTPSDSIEDSLSRGDVPRLEDHYVHRVKLEQEVVSKLSLLSRHKILVLHGMSGSGKSPLAVGVLRNNPELVSAHFNGVVFWLKIGDVKTDDAIIALQTKLQRKASSLTTHKESSYMNSSISMSSIGSNADSHSLTSYDWSWKELRDVLKTTFAEPALKEALLVLDEVNEKKCVEAFDIGCKLLITTRDTDVVANFNPQIITVENNFTEQEALQFLAQCLDINVKELPRQAKRLIEVCRSPFSLTLMGAQLAENKQRMLSDPRRWNYYIDKLQKKDFFFLSRNTEHNPLKTIEFCVKSLKPVTLPLFKMLSILPDNVKVPPKVLSKLWNIPIPEVEAILKRLKIKSLIIEFFDPDQRNYVYEIHDLIMNYLRTCLTEDEKKKLHVEFLKNYNIDTVNGTPDLIDDGYIAHYVGHHIFHTGNLYNKWDLFKLFLDLKFLGNKVRLTGPADAILDLQRYENLIALEEIDKELTYHIKAFLSTHGHDLYRYYCTDIVQSILQHESKGILYLKAYHMAQANAAKNELYFEFLHEQNVEEVKHSTIDVKESITAVCFLGDYVLVGTASGTIKVFHVYTNKLKKELISSSGAVKCVCTCPANPLILAAVSADGVIKIWYMDDMDPDISEGIIEEEMEEPHYNGTSINGDYAPVTIIPKIGPYLNGKWLNKDEVFLTHTSKMIILYSTKGIVIQVIDNFDKDRHIIDCVPTNDDRYVIVASTANSKSYIDVFDLRSKEKVVSFEESAAISNILSVPDSNRLLVINETQVVEHEFKFNSKSYGQNQFITYRTVKIISNNDVKENLKFKTAVVNKAGSLLFISTDDSRVICVDLKTNMYVFDLENRRGNIITMSVSEICYDEFVPGSDVLVSGSGADEHAVKVWYLGADYVSHNTQKHRKVRLTTKFDVSFLHTLSPQTPNHSPPNDINTSTPKRHQSFDTHKQIEKRTAKKTMSLDRNSLKPLNLKGICNGSDEGSLQPLVAIVDDKNCIQIMRGRKVFTEVIVKPDDKIDAVKISPCNQYVIYGLQSGTVKKYILRTKETKVIMDVSSQVQYLNFINSNLLMVAGKNRCLMAYRLCETGWQLKMLLKGNMPLGSQEILNDIQGIGPKNKLIANSGSLSQSGSETSLCSRERLFPSDSKSRLCKESYIVDCYHVAGIGTITVENNATVKLWSEELNLVGVLNGRQTDVYVSCAAFQKNVLVICDDYGTFQTFELKEKENKEIYLQTTNENKVNYRIVSCDLSADGHILAMGLDSGDVVIWNVPGKCQLQFLRHHKSKVQACKFSPVPDRLYRSSSSCQSPMVGQVNSLNNSLEEDQPPLVLVTMATEIVWWNVTYLMRIRAHNKGIWRTRVNVLSPLPSPMENKTELTAALNNMTLHKNNNFFFGDGNANEHDCWEALWKRKRCKEGSRKKEILACVKLSGVSAKKLCYDEKFSCFVTVDNTGNVHIMNVLKCNGS